MKKYILAVILGISTLVIGSNTFAECTLQDGTIINDCQQTSINSNVLIEWDLPTISTTGAILPIEDIGGTKLSIQNTQTGYWLGDTNITNNTYTSLYHELPKGNYLVVIWNYNPDGQSGPASPELGFRVKPKFPRYPTTYTLRVL